MEDRKKNRGLGRGLSALMSDINGPQTPTASTENQAIAPRRPDSVVPIEKVHPNPNQPRRAFAREGLEDLSNSIRTKGIIQPLIVRRKSSGTDEFEIVAGERRWRAAQMAQLHTIPVIIRDFDDTEVLEVAIIENIQRADLNPMEEAQGYRQLMDRFGHTQEKMAEALGKSRSYIANLLRLMHLPQEVQDYVREEKLSIGHARALITSDEPIALARKVIEQGLSVRETEKLVKKAAQGETAPVVKPATTRTSANKDADTKALEGDLTGALGMPVSINHHAGKESGTVTISYETLDQLDDLCRILSQR